MGVDLGYDFEGVAGGWLALFLSQLDARFGEFEGVLWENELSTLFVGVVVVGRRFHVQLPPLRLRLRCRRPAAILSPACFVAYP